MEKMSAGSNIWGITGGEDSEFSEKGDMLLFLQRLLGRWTGERLAETASGLTAALAESAVRAGILFGNRLFPHILIIYAPLIKGQRRCLHKLSQAQKMWYFR